MSDAPRPSAPPPPAPPAGRPGIPSAGRPGAAAARLRAAARVADLERELAATIDATAAGPDDEHDPEGSTIGFERARVQALLEAARASLARLEEVERGGGDDRCARCGQPIGSDRLEALPGTDRCVRCAARSAPRLGPGGPSAPCKAAGDGGAAGRR